MQTQKESVRTKILSISEELFLTKGYRKTTLNEIADKCGISKSNIYNYFKSKDSIFEYLTSDAKEKIEIVSNILSTNSFEGAKNLQNGLLHILFIHILPVKKGVILIYEREMIGNEKKVVHSLLKVVNSIVIPNLTIDENTKVLNIIAENLIRGYMDILKTENLENNMKYQISALTEYHVGGLAYLKQSVLEKQ